MKSVSDLPAKPLLDFMESIHTNGPIGGPITVDQLSSYMIFVYKIAEPLRQVDFYSMKLSMGQIHSIAVECGALKEKDLSEVIDGTLVNAMLHNAHMGTFFQRLASYVADEMRKL